jgi:hypothetical protein
MCGKEEMSTDWYGDDDDDDNDDNDNDDGSNDDDGNYERTKLLCCVLML